jgi:hypothetical protein
MKTKEYRKTGAGTELVADGKPENRGDAPAMDKADPERIPEGPWERRIVLHGEELRRLRLSGKISDHFHRIIPPEKPEGS